MKNPGRKRREAEKKLHGSRRGAMIPRQRIVQDGRKKQSERARLKQQLFREDR